MACSHSPADLMADLERMVQAAGTDGARVELITQLERLKSATAAAQARLTEAFAVSQRTDASLAQVAGDRSGAAGAAELDRSIASQVALARRESPHRGRQHVGLARALVREMPATLDALAQGEITEWQATLVVRETAVLSAADRQRVDEELCGRMEPMGDKRLADEARRIGDRLDPEAALRRLRRARADRRVTVRPAPGAMARLSGLLPLAQGVAAYAALRSHAVQLRTKGDPRGVAAIMADEMVARLLGESTAGAGPDVEVGLVMSERSLLRGGPDSALLTDAEGRSFGHLPALLARQLVREAHKAWMRRLYADPESGELVAMDSRRRTFTGALRKLVVWRDQTCAMPWCEAPIRHADHVRASMRGGRTSVANGEGLCEACNYAKEAPGWRADVVDLTPRRVEFQTPMGYRYANRPPPAPGQDRSSPEDQVTRARDDWIDGMGA